MISLQGNEREGNTYYQRILDRELVTTYGIPHLALMIVRGVRRENVLKNVQRQIHTSILSHYATLT